LADSDEPIAVARTVAIVFPVGVLVGLLLWWFGDWPGDERELAAKRARPWREKLLDPSVSPSVAWVAFAGGYVFLAGALVGLVVEHGLTWDIAGVALFGAAGVCLGLAALNIGRRRVALPLRLAGIASLAGSLLTIAISLFR
jgi:hypothetical protein